MLTKAQLSADQLANCRTVISVGQSKGVPTKGLIVAIATIFQESGARNLNYGDRDSVGLFQQRGNGAWGSLADRMDPAKSAGMFFDALKKVPNWEAMPVTMAAQKVQRSAYPLAYARWEKLATEIVTGAGVIAAPTDTPGGSPTDLIGGLQTTIGAVARDIGLGAVGILLIIIALFRITQVDKIMVAAGKAYATKGMSLLK